jgi:hypothetical protein
MTKTDTLSLFKDLSSSRIPTFAVAAEDLLVDEPHVLDYKKAYLLTVLVGIYWNR